MTRGVCAVGGLVGPEPLGALPVAGHLAVEGEADRVEDGGLAGAGGAGEQEQAGFGERVEVDRDPLRERAEGLDLKAVEAHQPAPADSSTSKSGSSQQASQASSRTSASASVAAVPRRSATKSRAISWSVRPCVRAAGGAGVARMGGLEGEDEGVREAAAQLVHGLERPGVVGEGRLDPGRLVAGETGVGQQGLEVAPDPRQRAGDGGVDELGRSNPAASSSTSQLPLRWPASEKE